MSVIKSFTSTVNRSLLFVHRLSSPMDVPRTILRSTALITSHHSRLVYSHQVCICCKHRGKTQGWTSRTRLFWTLLWYPFFQPVLLMPHTDGHPVDHIREGMWLKLGTSYLQEHHTFETNPLHWTCPHKSPMPVHSSRIAHIDNEVNLLLRRLSWGED